MECNLSKMQCVPCSSPDAKCLPDEQANELLRQIPDWRIQEEDGVKQLTKVYRFPDFVKALEFAQLVGNHAEQNNHHPALLIEWGRTTVQWWSHKLKGLHQNDFIMAAHTDEIFSTMLK